MTSWAKMTVNRCIARVVTTKSPLALNQPWFAVSIPWFAVSTPYSLKPRWIMSGLLWVIRGFTVSSVFFSYCSIRMHVENAENAVKSVFSSPRAERVWERAGEGLAIGVGKLFGFMFVGCSVCVWGIFPVSDIEMGEMQKRHSSSLSLLRGLPSLIRYRGTY